MRMLGQVRVLGRARARGGSAALQSQANHGAWRVVGSPGPGAALASIIIHIASPLASVEEGEMSVVRTSSAE